MLTPLQLQGLKADIIADVVLNAIPNTSDGAFEIAVAYNQPAVPNFYVWRTSVEITNLMQNGFDWTRVDNLTVGKARIWEFMTAVGKVNPALADVRAGFEATFSVEGGDQGTRQAIYNNSQKLATRAEKLFATGTGTTATHHGIGPAIMGFEGQISYQEVLIARNLP